MQRPTRHEQARAILELRGRKLASQILGRRAATAADFAEAFNLEMIDLLTEIPDREAMLALGRTVPGPRNGLYVLEDDAGFRVYLQEQGEIRSELRTDSFDVARNAVIERLIQLDGLPFRPPG